MHMMQGGSGEYSIALFKEYTILSLIFSSEAADDGMGQSDANSISPRTDEDNIGLASCYFYQLKRNHI